LNGRQTKNQRFLDFARNDSADEMAFGSYDVVRRTLQRSSSRRIVRHKNPKGFRTCADGDPKSQASKEESHADPVTYRFAKTQESFAHAISEPNAEIEAKKTITDTRTRSNSRRNASAFAASASCFRKKSLA
jgi:hypothetical protein